MIIKKFDKLLSILAESLEFVEKQNIMEHEMIIRHINVEFIIPNEKKQNIYYFILSIISCVIIFYFKNFSMALGTTERIPMELSVWSPILILTLFCSVGIMQINEK